MSGGMSWCLLTAIAVTIIGLTSGEGRCATRKTEENLDKCETADQMEQWAYVTVRPEVHTFYLLYKSTHADGWQNRPWVLWLQGGPGGSGVGYGNFEIIGPRNILLEARDTTWVQEVNVLFVDHPVGAGFSYVDDVNKPGLLTTTTEQATLDLYEVIKVVIQENPEFETLPFYVFGQSYGGKMGAHFTKYLYEEQIAGNVAVNTTGFAMGNAWISPIDSTTSWGGLLYWMNIVDEVGLAAINTKAEECRRAVEEERWVDATNLWAETEYVVWEHSNLVDFYNILNYNVAATASSSKTHQDKIKKGLYRSLQMPAEEPTLDELLNGPIREELDIIPDEVIWGGQYSAVFDTQNGDFMKPVITEVEDCLKDHPLHVVVYQGQLDLICDTKATMDWVRTMTGWSGLRDYLDGEQRTLRDPNTGLPEMFVKAKDNFKFYKVLEAGHAVPHDQGWPALRMLQRIIADQDR